MNDKDYTFVGFTPVPGSAAGPWVPVFLLNDTPYDHNTFSFLSYNPTPHPIIYLSKLYKLKQIRNLDFSSLVYPNGFTFTDDQSTLNINIVRNKSNPLYANSNPLNENEQGPRRDAIRQIELQYPGLFKRMFITEEEEQQALREIREKEEAKRIEDLDEIEKILKRI